MVLTLSPWPDGVLIVAVFAYKGVEAGNVPSLHLFLNFLSPSSSSSYASLIRTGSVMIVFKFTAGGEEKGTTAASSNLTSHGCPTNRDYAGGRTLRRF